MAGIYIHVPFCKQKCTYCDFASFPKEINKAEAYFACLYREIKGRSEELKDYTFDTIYFGGGTPSVVPANYISGAIKQVKKYYKLTENAEITIELNPGTVDEEKLKEYQNAGINRFSIGLQTGYDEDLKRLNRIHTAKDFLLTCKMLDGKNKSADVLIGLAGQTEEKLLKTLELALAGGVKHVSMYALTPEVGTPIYTDYLNWELLSDDEVADLYHAGVKYLKEKGLDRYEVSNFAVKGYESKHNLNYWQRGEYIGFGVSASSFIKERRFTNSFILDEYMSFIIGNKNAEVSSDNIEGNDRKNEFIMLALRTAQGIDKQRFNVIFETDFDKEYKEVLVAQGKYLDVTEKVVKIKDEYLFVQNEIIINFFKD